MWGRVSGYVGALARSAWGINSATPRHGIRLLHFHPCAGAVDAEILSSALKNSDGSMLLTYEQDSGD